MGRAVLLALIFSLALATPTRAQTAATPTWTVQPGDALTLVAQRFDVTVDELRRWNDLEGDTIYAGQELQIAPVEPTIERETAPHRIRRGETLSHVALQHGTTVEAILSVNPGLQAERVREGQELRIPVSAPALDYTLQRGETLSRVADRHEVAVRDLVRWNPGLRPDAIREGQVVRVYSTVPLSRSESIGRPDRGALRHAEPLPPHPGYIVRDRDRAFGTLETVRWIVDGFDALRRAHPRAPRVRIHDLSDTDGGPIRDHRSHQSGRDADVTYFQRACPEDACAMRRLRPEELDVARQWALFERWLRQGRIEAIFVDYALQAPLYEHARARGATREELERWFQYPRGRGNPHGLIRHFPKHRDHLHVRFVCPDTDPECR